MSSPKIKCLLRKFEQNIILWILITQKNVPCSKIYNLKWIFKPKSVVFGGKKAFFSRKDLRRKIKILTKYLVINYSPTVRFYHLHFRVRTKKVAYQLSVSTVHKVHKCFFMQFFPQSRDFFMIFCASMTSCSS